MAQNTIIYEPMTRERLLQFADGREIWIYGAGAGGQMFAMALERNDIEFAGFVDRADFPESETGHCRPVLKPAVFLSSHTAKDSFLVLTQWAFAKGPETMRGIIEPHGFEYKRDFLFVRDIVQLFPSVDIAGVCNFSCIACPRGSTVNPMEKGGFMPVEIFEKILEKLLRDIPFLLDLEPYLWCEPTLHPQLAEIVKICKKHKVGCHIATNLNVAANLRTLVEAEPTHILAAVSGFGDGKYSMTQRGGKWELFEKNLRDIVAYKKETGSKTIICVNYHLNRDNLDEYKPVYDLCRELGIKLNAMDSFVFQDVVMDYLDGLSDETTELAFNLNLKSIDKELERCRTEKEKLCLIRLALPNILYDGSVVTCCQSYRGKLADNYLDVSIEELIEQRNKCEHCKKCISMALHRWKEPVAVATDASPQRVLELALERQK